MRTTESIFATLLALAAIAPPAAAGPITLNGITLSDQNLFADNKGINDIGISPGFEIRFGGEIAGGSAGYSGAGIFTPTGAKTPTITQSFSSCAPTAGNPEFCARFTGFKAAKLAGTWDFAVESPSGATATFGLPLAAPIPTTPVPFPTSVTITNSASGINPTISWTLPGSTSPGGGSYIPDAFRINIYDRSIPPLPDGVANGTFSTILASTATSYVVPTSASLISGDKYTIEFQMITTRDGGPNSSNSNADILTRSSTYYDFTPEPAAKTPGPIALAMVDGATGVYHFDVGSVGPDSVTYIDPTIAVGYKYATGAGDPNFASVLLPDVGGGMFDLSYLSTEVPLDAGDQYFFPAGGVADFTVTGIDPSADLDPADTSAFVTGLTFVKDGSFTGTMTPLTEDIAAAPEPGSLGLLAAGLALLGCAGARRRKSAPGKSVRG